MCLVFFRLDTTGCLSRCHLLRWVPQIPGSRHMEALNRSHGGFGDGKGEEQRRHYSPLLTFWSTIHLGRGFCKLRVDGLAGFVHWTTKVARPSEYLHLAEVTLVPAAGQAFSWDYPTETHGSWRRRPSWWSTSWTATLPEGIRFWMAWNMDEPNWYFENISLFFFRMCTKPRVF